MLNELLIHDLTRKELRHFLSRPRQTLLLSGEVAAGKKTLARAIAAELLKVGNKALSTHAYYTELTKPADKRNIGVEDVRKMQRSLSLLTTGKRDIRRVVLIADADQLNTEGQNTLLKTLEEPPDFTVFILTSSRPRQLLPTIQSRLQNISVRPVPLQPSEEFMNSDNIAANWNLSGGSAGLLHALQYGGTEHELKKAVEDAKVLLKMDVMHRLVLVDKLSKDHEKTELLLLALQKVLGAVQASSSMNSIVAKNLTKKRFKIQTAYANQQNGANAKLLLTDLMLNL